MVTRNSFRQQREAVLANSLLDPNVSQAITTGIASLTSNAQDAAKRLNSIQEPIPAANMTRAIASLTPEQQQNLLTSNLQNQSEQPTPNIPSNERASVIRQGLINRGMQPHVADAFLVNFQDESGLDPSINEHNPLVPGSRGGFGLYQLTGPRRNAYESFASQRGANLGDIDTQLDFLMTELQGPEARAAQRIFSAPNTAAAAQAIVSSFLRPAEQHRNSRMARYARL